MKHAITSDQTPLFTSCFKQAHFVFLRGVLFCCVSYSSLPAQQPSVYSPAIHEASSIDSKLTLISADREHAAWNAYESATPESLAALKDDDPLLRDMYVMYGLKRAETRPYDTALLADMQRRGKVTVDILIEGFRHPYSTALRGRMLRDVSYYPLGTWDRLLPLARQWYAQIKKIPLEPYTGIYSDRDGLAQFISVAGEPQDEPILRDLLGEEALRTEEMKRFLARMAKLKQAGAPPPQAAVVKQPTIPAKPAKLSATPSAAQPESSPDHTLPVTLIIGAVVLLALVLWKIKKM